MKRAINYFDEHDELYWNAVGVDWSVPIKDARAIVTLPIKLREKELKKECYSGVLGSKNVCQNKKINFSSDGSVESLVFYENNLAKGEGLTVVVGWPKGVVKQPGIMQRLYWFLSANYILFAPILFFIFLFYCWKKYGKDPKSNQPIISYFEAPKNYSPAMVGTVIDDRVDKRDLSAEIVEMAIKGFLRIEKVQEKSFFKRRDYKLYKLKEASGLKQHQQIIFNGLFEIDNQVKLSDLKEKFYKTWKKAEKKVYSQLVEDKIYKRSPQSIKTIYWFIAVLFLLFVSTAIAIWGWAGAISFVLMSILFFIFGYIMPAKTMKGVFLKEKIMGFKEYLRVAEKARIDFHNAPAKNPQTFEGFLPYAMVLKVEKEWAKQFEGIYAQNPNWYTDGSANVFTAAALVSSLDNFSTYTNSSLATRPGGGAASGGSGFSGGFSGGGFGGGGGGSW